MRILTYILVLALLIDVKVVAQSFDMGAFTETYWGLDDLQSKTHNRPDFLYNHSQSDQLALNLALVQGSLTDSLWRLRGGVMAGTYVERNLASESGGLRHIYESTIGVRLSARGDIWLEAGVFPSHIGYETVISSDNPTLTRSLIAENSPYYESGIKLSGTNAKHTVSFALAALNGWQRITRPAGHYPPSLGWQVKWDPSERWSFNYSGYIGDESADEDLAIRHFHDVYARYKSANNCQIVASIDYGMQPDLSTEDWTMSSWYGGTLMLSIPFGKQWALNGRLEQYVDRDEILVSNPYDDGFVLSGYSLGLDYRMNEWIMFRGEAKRFDGPGFSFIQHDDAMTNVAHLFHLSAVCRIP